MSTEISPLSLRHHMGFWAFVAALTILALWLLQDILLPFVMGLAIAYLLNPVVEALKARGLNRTLATSVILAGFTLLVALLALVLGPVLYKELALFSKELPAYIGQVETMLAPYIEQMQAYIGRQQENGFEGVSQYSGMALKASQTVLGGVLAGGAVLSAFVSFVVLTPIIAFFMMRDWPNIVNWMEGLVPMGSKDDVLSILAKINQKISGFVRGQILVAIILGCFYAIACSIAGLKYGLIIGLFAGLLNIIPMLGSITGFVIGVSVAYLQTGDLIFVATIAGIFLFGQIAEGNFLTPKLVGDSVGLHPLWIFFALMAGGALLGITGMLIAVPVVASLGVLIGFAVEKYKASPYYKNQEPGRDNRAKTAKTKPTKTPKKGSDKR